MEAGLNIQNKKFLMNLLTILKKEVPLEYEDVALIFMQINTEEKLTQFKDWIKTKMKNNTFQTTAEEILNKTAQLGKIIAQ